MKRPLDPRHHNKEPKRVHTKEARITLADLDRDLTHKVPLTAVIGAWNKALKDHESQGHRIVDGPNFQSSSFYGSALSLTYTYEWDNLNFVKEITEWNAAITEYEQKFQAWKQFEEDRKRVLIMGTKNIDALIERAEHRLANLKAKKAGEPLPYPEG